DFSDSNDEFYSTDDDSFSTDNIEYVEASPPDSELVSSQVMEIVIPKVGVINDDILLTIKDDILREKLLNINLLIANIEALNDNPTPSSDFMTMSSSTSCGSNAQCGHYCTPQVPFICPEPSYSQDFNFSRDIHDFQQQPTREFSVSTGELL
nr:hypothetical protein [Tanacetum cinerariifolium]